MQNKHRPEMVIFVGLQGAGKSSFYRERFATTHNHVSKDNFRSNKNKARRQEQLILEAFANGRNVVVDNTNLTREDRATLVTLARQFDAEVIGYYFTSSLEQSLRRNAGRAGRERVPDVALYVANSRLEVPVLDEGFDTLFRVNLEDDGFHVHQISDAI